MRVCVKHVEYINSDIGWNELMAVATMRICAKANTITMGMCVGVFVFGFLSRIKYYIRAVRHAIRKYARSTRKTRNEFGQRLRCRTHDATMEHLARNKSNSISILCPFAGREWGICGYRITNNHRLFIFKRTMVFARKWKNLRSVWVHKWLCRGELNDNRDQFKHNGNAKWNAFALDPFAKSSVGRFGSIPVFDSNETHMQCIHPPVWDGHRQQQLTNFLCPQNWKCLCQRPCFSHFAFRKPK